MIYEILIGKGEDIAGLKISFPKLLNWSFLTSFIWHDIYMGIYTHRNACIALSLKFFKNCDTLFCEIILSAGYLHPIMSFIIAIYLIPVI